MRGKWLFLAMGLAAVLLSVLWGAAQSSEGSEEPGIQAYKGNYFLYTRDYADHSGHELQPDRQWAETRFQFSLKAPLLRTQFFPLFFAFTQKSFWQLFDEPGSRPFRFRENNYNPEFFLQLFDGEAYPVQVGL